MKTSTNQRGVSAIIIAIAIVMLFSFAALAIDIGHLYLVRNELKNAADAGALAGARLLYNADGTSVNTGANQVGYEAATINTSEKNTQTGSLLPVDVDWTAGTNDGDVQRGHWSFATRTFTPNSSTVALRLGDYSTAELDANTDFINAVHVYARRSDTPAQSFFARMFGYSSFNMTSHESVAWLGYAGTLEPLEVDEPIAICKQSIKDQNGKLTCGTGRMINSATGGGGSPTSESGGWTNFTQDSSCAEASTPTVRPLIKCGGGSNTATIFLGQPVGLTNGDLQNVFDDLIQCWQRQAGLCTIPGRRKEDPPQCPSSNSNNPADYPTAPWKMTLLVINCCEGSSDPSDPNEQCERPQVESCKSETRGAVELNVVWISRTGFRGTSPAPLPLRMAGIPDLDPPITDWVSPGSTDPMVNWNDFASHFRLQNSIGGPATNEDKTIYFLPDCAPHEPTGNTGGENFGVMAKYPKLVR